MDHPPYSSDLALEIPITESLAPQIVEQDKTIPHQESI